jgi:sigma-B regulation protein RsbU (phosphoserine phosphatase)
LFYGQYDDATRELTYLNCGHLPPIVVRADGTVEQLESSGTVVGLFRTWNGEPHRVSIGRGDTLAIFSDGVTEAGIESDADFGEQRLTSMLAALRNECAERALERIVESVRSFGGGQQSDDITLILLRGK